MRITDVTKAVTVSEDGICYLLSLFLEGADRYEVIDNFEFYAALTHANASCIVTRTC